MLLAWKHQKTRGIKFSGGIEGGQYHEISGDWKKCVAIQNDM